MTMTINMTETVGTETEIDHIAEINHGTTTKETNHRNTTKEIYHGTTTKETNHKTTTKEINHRATTKEIDHIGEIDHKITMKGIGPTVEIDHETTTEMNIEKKIIGKIKIGNIEVDTEIVMKTCVMTGT